MKNYLEYQYITLPGSPYWSSINYDNIDNQPDYSYNLEKTLETEYLIAKLLRIINISNSSKSTYLEYLVNKKRNKLKKNRS